MEQKSKKIDVKIIVIVIVVIIAVIEGIVIFASNNESGTSKKMTKNEMLEIAKDKTSMSFFRTLQENKALAETQKNKIFKIQEKISQIEKDYCTFYDGTTPPIQIKIYLDPNILVNLKTGQSITIVGTLSNITTEQKGMTYFCIFELKDCYLLEE